MPVVTITMIKGRESTAKRELLDAVHDALISVGVPDQDRFQRLIELEQQNFVFDSRFPDLDTPRSMDFSIIEILWSFGRSVKTKKAFMDHLLSGVSRVGIDPENLMVVFVETQLENWSFSGGRFLNA